jgi:hypothetical protein
LVQTALRERQFGSRNNAALSSFCEQRIDPIWYRWRPIEAVRIGKSRVDERRGFNAVLAQKIEMKKGCTKAEVRCTFLP